jgi:hypothetical protein
MEQYGCQGQDSMSDERHTGRTCSQNNCNRRCSCTGSHLPPPGAHSLGAQPATGHSQTKRMTLSSCRTLASSHRTSAQSKSRAPAKVCLDIIGLFYGCGCELVGRSRRAFLMKQHGKSKFNGFKSRCSVFF